MCGWYLKWSVLMNTFAQFAIISITVASQCCVCDKWSVQSRLNSNWRVYLLNFDVASPHAKVLWCNSCHLAVGNWTYFVLFVCLFLTYYFSSCCFLFVPKRWLRIISRKSSAHSWATVCFLLLSVYHIFYLRIFTLQNFQTLRCECVCKFRFECVIPSYFCNYCFNESFKLFIDVLPKRKKKRQKHACYSLQSKTLVFICFVVR